MKIGFYSPYIDTLSGGEKYILTAASVASAEHDVTIFWDDTEVIKKAGNRFDIDLSKVTVAPNIFLPTASFVKRLSQTRDLDFLFFLSDGSIPLSLSKKLIIHLQFPVVWIPSLSWKEKLKVRRVSTFVCNSKFTKGFIDKKYKVNSKVIYPPVDIEMPVMKKENIILTIGRYSKFHNGDDFKKISVMIDQFKKMYDTQKTNWKFVIVTSFLPEQQEALEQLQSSIAHYPIEILRDVTFEQLNQLYATSKIYWHAAGFGEDLTAHPELAEHFGISTAEAMAAGAVPIVYNAGGLKEIV